MYVVQKKMYIAGSNFTYLDLDTMYPENTSNTYDLFKSQPGI